MEKRISVYFFLRLVLLFQGINGFQNEDQQTIKLPSCTPEKPNIFRAFRALAKQGSDMQRILEATAHPNTTASTAAQCKICITVLNLIKSQVDACASVESLTDMIAIGCQATKMSPSPEICMKIGKQFLPLVYAVIRSNSNFDVQSACALLLQGQPGCCGSSSREANSLSVKIPPIPKKTKSCCAPAPSSCGGGKFKIIHLTDFHLDLSYNVNGSVKSGGIIGCRSKTFEPNVSAQAGPCGQYGCDSSLDTVCSAFASAARNHCKANSTLLIFLTGDYHNFELDEQSRVGIEDHFKAVFQKCAFKYFDKRRCNFKMYPAIGNHDSYPAFSFPSKCFDVSKALGSVWTSENLDAKRPWFCNKFVYEALARNFKGHLTSAALRDLRHLGYYFEDFECSLRIVVLNTNLPYKYNFYLTQDFNDAEQLQWLIDVLTDAEACGKKVFILLHVPPGGDLWHLWCHKFAEVLGRFRSIIRGVFGGHEHRNDLRLLNGTTVYLASSITTFGGEITKEGASVAGGVNPCYSVYEVEGGEEGCSSATWRVVDICDYCYDLGKCRRSGGRRNWEKMCCLKDVLGGVPDLEFETVQAAVKGLAKDENKFEKYYRCYSTNSPVQSCEDCASKILNTILDPCPKTCFK